MPDKLFIYENEASYNDDCYLWRMRDWATDFYVARPWKNNEDIFSLAREYVETFRLGDSLQQTVVHYPTMVLLFQQFEWRHYIERYGWRRHEDEVETVAECVETTYIEVNTLTGETKKLPEKEGKKMLEAQAFSPSKMLVESETYFLLVEESAKLKAHEELINETAKKLGWYGPAHADFFETMLMLQKRQQLECAIRARELLEAVDAPMVGKKTRKHIEDTLKSNFFRVL